MEQSIPNKFVYNVKKYGLLYTVELILKKFKIKREMSFSAILRHQRYYEKLKKEDYKKELREIYTYYMNEKLDLDHPILFTEKIQWLILHDSTRQKAELADKYLARDWIKNQIGEKYLIPLLGVWDDFEKIDFKRLPNQFVLKCNHGSGFNCVVEDKEKMDYKKIQKKFKHWMQINFAFWLGLELHYADIPRKIIAEKYMEQLDGRLLDYKVHCFMGEPQYIQVIGDRNLLQHTGAQMVFDKTWNAQDWSFGDYPKFSQKIKCPEILEEMLEVSRKLSQEFLYVRIDFYILENELKFGEMTFTPGGGIYKYNNDWSHEANKKLGDLIDIGKVNA